MNDSYSFGAISAGAMVDGIGAFEIEVAENAPDGHTAIIEIEFNGDGRCKLVRNNECYTSCCRLLRWANIPFLMLLEITMVKLIREKVFKLLLM